ncbi:flagellar export chaperone FliS [Paludibacterium paludis]|uniref:Flagellar secretion chaperone FliS n=1 Tax=Paludibacterium paludis TaxID=1225769 RepID=A0A918UCA5_9NEIS|nr:flagellar export chaperone FliS [Paludibacterium paludis]GGY29641.1 flagellar protein FliS [Paludibacterium paludis]
MNNRLALQQFSKAYENDALEVAVYGASPVGLIVLLYEGAIKALNQAKVFIGQNRFQEKAAMISRAQDILEGLRVALDHEKGKQVTRNLEDLYQYSKYRLGIANLNNDVNILDEIANLLGILLPAWQELDRRPKTPDAAASPAAKAGL